MSTIENPAAEVSQTERDRMTPRAAKPWSPWLLFVWRPSCFAGDCHLLGINERAEAEDRRQYRAGSNPYRQRSGAELSWSV